MTSKLSIDPEQTAIQIQRFISEYLDKTGHDGVVLGLSGGIDSAVGAVLARKELGKKKTECIFMPDSATPQEDYDHVRLLADTYDLNLKTKDITPIVSAFEDNSPERPDLLALANIKARIRMILLYQRANMGRRLVCGTSNKSELMVGYFTKYGDGGVDIMPIADLYKTQIWELARHVKMPEPVIAKPASARLFEGQTDEAELKMTYATLDIVLSGIEQKFPDDAIADAADTTASEVERIRTMVMANDHKRAPAVIARIY
jgi:NAD+ synthase